MVRPTGTHRASRTVSRADADPRVRSVVHHPVVVADDDIRDAQRWLWERARVAAEPGGAAGLAAILSRAYVPAVNESVVVLVSGGNINSLPQ